MRLSILFLAICVSSSLMAQKPKVSAAKRALTNGDYATAKEIVDAAVVYEKLDKDPKTWFLRGRVYMAIDTSNAQLVEKPEVIAMESFNKAAELGDKKKLFTLDANGAKVEYDQHINSYWAHFYNQGATAYSEQEFDDAINYFEKSQLIIPEDTNGYINAGIAAHNSQRFDRAITNYEKSLKYGVKSQDIYSLYISLLTSETKEYEKALKVTREALELFPGDRALARSEIVLLIELDKTEEAKNNLLQEIEEDPSNSSLYFTLGVLYEELKDKEGAMESYKKAVEVDADNFNANFNLGVLLINQATEVIKEQNNLGISDADLKKAEELEPVIEEKLKMAVPQWEKVHELDANDRTAIETLEYIFKQLKQYDLAESYTVKREALGAEEDE